MTRFEDQYGSKLRPGKPSERGGLITRSGFPLLCAFGDCQKPAKVEFSLPLWDEKKNALLNYCFCSPEHQAAQLHEWGEI